MGKWVHRLSDIDDATKTGTCSNCGLVKLTKKGKNYRCMTPVRAFKHKYRYGYEYREDRAEQCEVCGSKSRICQDHNHATGKFRGWLCVSCNLALGYAQDNPEILHNLADYLEKQTPSS